MDIRGAGFYDSNDFVLAGLGIYDVSLCKELLKWPAAVIGFNPYVQRGSGDVTYVADR